MSHSSAVMVAPAATERDMTMDPFAPTKAKTLADVRDYLVAVHAGEKAVVALERAWGEWER